LSILRKTLTEISIADLDALVESTARETGELEFKGTLPFIPTKGQSTTADRWIEKGDRIGDYARDQLLAEIVAFANADGGTLVIGMQETKDEPRRAEGLQPIPNCEGLTRRLIDATEDVIEPRLPTISGRALPAQNDGSGYVILRVGKSLAGPHRLTTTREFYVRRGERTARMSVREIKDYTLETTRSADRLEVAFEERHANASKQYSTLLKQAQGKLPGIPPLVIRATAVPTTPQQIPELTRRQELWWLGKRFRLSAAGTEIDCGYPLNESATPPKTRLRSFVSDVDPTDNYVSRLLRSDGAVEFLIGHHHRSPSGSTKGGPRVYLGWLISLLVGTICQVEHLRRHLAWDSVEFGLEAEVWCNAPLHVAWTDRDFMGATLKDELPFTLPRYSLAPGANFDELIMLAVRDVFDACGSFRDHKCSVPWQSLLN